jgi:hypothetical protein
MSWVAIGVGVVGAAGTAYSASQAGEGAPAPAQVNPGQSLMQYIRGLKKGLPSLTGLESEYRPQYGQLNINDQQQYLNALLGMSGQATGAAGQQLQAARQEDLANMQLNAGGVNQLLGMVDPQGRAMADRATSMANDAYNRAQGPMSFQEGRTSDQQAREAFASRGRLNDNVSVVGEILGREEVKAAQRAEAQQLGNNAFALNQQFSSPALGMLMSTPASLAYGQDLLGRSQGIIGQNTPQLINPDAGINMGMQNASNLNAYNMAQATAQQNSAAQWGQMGTSLLGLAGDIYTNR